MKHDMTKALDVLLALDRDDPEEYGGSPKPVLSIIIESITEAMGVVDASDPLRDYLQDVVGRLKVVEGDLATYRQDLKAVFDGLGDFLP